MSNKKTLYVIVAFLLIGFVLWSASSPWLGWCPESIFKISREQSRLPKWFTIPPGYDRGDLAVTIYLYVPPFGKSNFKAILSGPPPDNKTLDKRIGIHQWHPTTAKEFQKQKTYEVYPSYMINTIDGIAEILEHREPGNILYVSDDPELKKAIGKD